MRTTIVIPWRSSGDPDRDAAQHYVEHYYRDLAIGPVIITTDGRQPGQPFNRHAAYNRALTQATTDTIAWIEADTLIPKPQLILAAHLATQTPGIVIPYTERHELDHTQTATVYAGTNPFTLTGQYAIYRDGTSIGQAGITSQHTITLIGGQWDERFQGWGYDDNAMHHIYATLAGPPRWTPGKGIHLWHTPEHQKPRTTHSDINAQHCAQLLAITNPTQLRAALTRPNDGDIET